MGDLDLRELERRFRQEGGPEREAAWLRERLRVGELGPERLLLAAAAGHAAARSVAPPPVRLWAREVRGGGELALDVGARLVCGSDAFADLRLERLGVAPRACELTARGSGQVRVRALEAPVTLDGRPLGPDGLAQAGERLGLGPGCELLLEARPGPEPALGLLPRTEERAAAHWRAFETPTPRWAIDEALVGVEGVPPPLRARLLRRCGPDPWYDGVHDLGLEAEVRAALAGARAAWPVWQATFHADGVGDERADPSWAPRSLRAAQAWALCPCEAHRRHLVALDAEDPGRESLRSSYADTLAQRACKAYKNGLDRNLAAYVAIVTPRELCAPRGDVLEGWLGTRGLRLGLMAASTCQGPEAVLRCLQEEWVPWLLGTGDPIAARFTAR